MVNDSRLLTITLKQQQQQKKPRSIKKESTKSVLSNHVLVSFLCQSTRH